MVEVESENEEKSFCTCTSKVVTITLDLNTLPELQKKEERLEKIFDDINNITKEELTLIKNYPV